MLFHLVIGAMYLAKEEMTYEGKNVSAVRKLLKTIWVRSVCSKNPDDTELPAFTQFKSNRYSETIESFTLVLFLRIHAYGFLSAILVFMSRLGIDSL